MRKPREIDPNQALLDRQYAMGDVVFVDLSERGWAYPACNRPLWWGDQLMGRCEARATWSVNLPAGKRMYCTNHAHATLVFVDALAESERYAERAAQRQALENAPTFQAPES